MGADVLSIASVGLSSLSSGASALGQSSADSYQAAQLDRAAQYGELKATQTSAQLTRNMGMTLANMDAVRAVGQFWDVMRELRKAAKELEALSATTPPPDGDKVPDVDPPPREGAMA